MDHSHATPGEPAGPDLALDEAKAKVAELTAPRVSEVTIKGRIASVSYIHEDLLTICKITMVNGFNVIGHSAPASAENFDADIGKRFAYENAFRQLWQLEGYLLREALHRREVADQQFDSAGMGAATSVSDQPAPAA